MFAAPTTAKEPLTQGTRCSAPVHVRLAFIGTGRWGRRYHLPTLEHVRKWAREKVRLDLVGIYGLQQREAQELQACYGFAWVYRDLNELIEDRTINAVAVAITPSAVRGVLEQLLPRKLAILCEKPPGVDYEEAQILAKLITVPHVVAFNRRYNPMNNQFKDMVHRMPTIRRVRGCMYRRDRREDHFILHTGIHMINLLEYIFGPIVRVRNELRGRPGERGFVHTAHIRFASGLPGELVFAPRSGEQWEGVEAIGENQRIFLQSPHEGQTGRIVAEDGSISHVIEASPDDPPLVREGYRDEYLDLFQAMANGTQTRSNFQNALNSMRIATAIENMQDLCDELAGVSE